MGRFLEVFRLAGREPSTRIDVENELQFHLAEMEDLLMAQGASREAARDEAAAASVTSSSCAEAPWPKNPPHRPPQWIRISGPIAIRRARTGARQASPRRRHHAGLAIGANATMFGVVDRLLSAAGEIPNANDIRRVTMNADRRL
jgi:hypothetical protein